MVIKNVGQVLQSKAIMKKCFSTYAITFLKEIQNIFYFKFYLENIIEDIDFFMCFLKISTLMASAFRRNHF